MVKTELTDQLIRSGGDLLRLLDEHEVLTTAALWFYFPDIEAWKLLLCTPKLIEEGPKAAYTRLQSVLRGLGEDRTLELDDIGIAPPDAPIIKLLKIAIVTGPGISGIRFTNNVISGQLVRDAYIYRLMDVPEGAPEEES